MRFFTVEKLGPKQSLTPEGFLLCEDVPIARTGRMLYGPGETTIDAGPDGVVYIDRREEDVFADKTVASFQGKPVTNDHPPEGVTPENWKELAVGTVINPRRGKFPQEDLLIADLLITDPNAIEDVRAGKREVSCGYDCDYFETGPGKGYQTNIIGNHVALVDAGRCGRRCAINDHAFQEDKESNMTVDKIFAGVKDKLRKAFATKDEAAFNEALAGLKVSAQDGEIHVHLPEGSEENRSKYNDEALESKFAELEKRHEGHEAKDKAHDEAMGALEGRVDKLEKDSTHGPVVTDANETEAEKKEAEEMKEEAGDGYDKKTKDSALFSESFQATVAAAEIIAPGIQIPTFDSAANPRTTFRAICGLRRKALDQALQDTDMTEIIAEFRGGRTLDSKALKNMGCSAVRDLFFGVASVRKRMNNSGPAVTVNSTVAAAGGAPMTLAQLNERNRKHYGG